MLRYLPFYLIGTLQYPKVMAKLQDEVDSRFFSF
jgi:hypothetical protein